MLVNYYRYTNNNSNDKKEYPIVIFGGGEAVHVLTSSVSTKR